MYHQVKRLLPPLLLFNFLPSFTLPQNETTTSQIQNQPVSITTTDHQRFSPPSPLPGTINFELLTSTPSIFTKFTPRHSHATCIFRCPSTSPSTSTKNCIFLTGGYSKPFRTYNLEITNLKNDVWYSENGIKWTQLSNLNGDFLDGVGNYDAKKGSKVAPWYGRYGHSLDALGNGRNDDDGLKDVMVLAGGFNPIAANDVWLSPDGSNWFFDDYAPWPERAYHATVIFKKELWIMGGTPLRNDVWIGRLVRDSSSSSSSSSQRTGRRPGYRMAWRLISPHAPEPNRRKWSPRAGLCAVSQFRWNYRSTSQTETMLSEHLYVLGGFGGYDHPGGDRDLRSRNDVWTTQDGMKWTRVKNPGGNYTMPWGARSWHGCVTWHDWDDPAKGVNRAALDDSAYKGVDVATHPRIYVLGGGYTGTNRNNVVREMEGYVDVWWSHDGSDWKRVNYEEGSKESLYSTSGWSLTEVDGDYIHLGKWGHTVESFITEVDLNRDGVISKELVSIEFCGGYGEDVITTCKIANVSESKVPALFVIAGDTVDKGPVVNDVFVSRPGVLCEIDGVTCSGRGTCGPGMIGCVCDSESFVGEFCERGNEESVRQSSAQNFRMSWSKTLLFCLVASILCYHH